MSFLFCWLTGELFRYPVAKKFRFDNFELAAYRLGFLLPLVPLLVETLTGEIRFRFLYRDFFNPVVFIASFLVLATAFRIYCGNYRESLFLALPTLGLLCNLLAEFSTESLPSPLETFLFQAPVANFAPLIPVLAILLASGRKLRHRTKLRVFGALFLVFLAVQALIRWNVSSALSARHPAMEILSLKPADVFGWRSDFIAWEKGTFYVGSAAFGEKPQREILRVGETSDHLLDYFSFGGKLDYFFFDLFNKPRFEVGKTLDRITVTVGESGNLPKPWGIGETELELNLQGQLQSVRCKTFTFFEIELPCASIQFF